MRPLIAGIAATVAVAVAATAPSADAASCGRDALRPVKRGDISPSGVYTKSASERAAPRAVLCLINVQRAAAGVAPLRNHPMLHALANKHTGDLVKNGYANPADPHLGSDGSTVASRLRPYTANFGRASFRIAETVWEDSHATPVRAVRWWMSSRDHRPILLDPGLEEVGIAVYAKRPGGGPGGTFTADFGTARN